MGVLRSWLNITSFQLGGDRSRCSWKISVKLTTMGGRLGLSSGNRLAPAKKTDLAVRADWKMDQRRKPQRVKWSGCAQSPLYTQWPRLKSIRGRQYRNASRAGHVEILSQTRAVSGIDALVTTPLRLVVTRAPSVQASHAPGDCLSQGLLFRVGVVIRAHLPDHWGPQAPLDAAPPLATRV